MKLDYRALLALAYAKALESPDPSTQNGALLISDAGKILAADCNRFPDGVHDTKERWERPLKYKIIEHAERNACYAAGKAGIKTDELVMVCCWATCTDCARAIIQCGVKRLVTHKQAYDRSPESWKTDIDLALQMLREAGVEFVMYDGIIGVVSAVRHSGQLWHP